MRTEFLTLPATEPHPRRDWAAARNALADFERHLGFPVWPFPGFTDLLPPLQHLNVALSVSVFKRPLCVRQSEAGARPPVQHLDEASSACPVEGFGSLFLFQDCGVGAPPFKNLGRVVDKTRFVWE
jgi:hypothetical protein